MESVRAVDQASVRSPGMTAQPLADPPSVTTRRGRSTERRPSHARPSGIRPSTVVPAAESTSSVRTTSICSTSNEPRSARARERTPVRSSRTSRVAKRTRFTNPATGAQAAGHTRLPRRRLRATATTNLWHPTPGRRLTVQSRPAPDAISHEQQRTRILA